MTGFNLEAEVRDLCARRDITDALCRYMRGQDRLDPVLHRSAFHGDARVDCGLMAGTADEFVAFAQGFLAELGGSQHILGQVQLEIAGDQATGEAYFCAWHRLVENDVSKDLFVAGRYVDRYACREGDWRIVERVEVLDWARTDPATDAFLDKNPSLLRGARCGADFSQQKRD